uniref:Ankyrin repeat protein n=1 Tax=Mimivirus LCMiAC02 TaxID=2506609 RepID=A0A4D5XFI8_9VIRU|nr:MAG: ankyrin repeat protein [Mimivirus LCMiAC02]
MTLTGKKRKRKSENDSEENNRMKKKFKVIYEHLICPITKMLLHNPVSVEDGQVYEKEAIDKWFSEHDTSPTTGLEISTDTHSVLAIKNMVDELIEHNPEYKEDRYVPDITYNTNKTTIMKFMRYKRFDKLLLYKYFLIMDPLPNYMDNTSIIEYLCKRCKKDNVIRYVLDNCIDIECQDTISGMYPIHIICRYGSENIIKYIVEKGVNLNCFTTYNYSPMYYICRLRNYDMIKYFVDKGINLNAVDNGNRNALHTVCKYNKYNVVKYLVDANANFMIKNNNGNLPVNICFSCQDKITILYMLSKYYDYMMTHDYKTPRQHTIEETSSVNPTTTTTTTTRESNIIQLPLLLLPLPLPPPWRRLHRAHRLGQRAQRTRRLQRLQRSHNIFILDDEDNNEDEDEDEDNDDDLTLFDADDEDNNNNTTTINTTITTNTTTTDDNSNNNFMDTTNSFKWLSQNKKINQKDMVDILFVLRIMTKKEKDRTITQDDINNILNLNDKTFDITIK